MTTSSTSPMPSDPSLPRLPASSPPSSVWRRSVAVLVVVFLAGGWSDSANVAAAAGQSTFSITAPVASVVGPLAPTDPLAPAATHAQFRNIRLQRGPARLEGRLETEGAASGVHYVIIGRSP